MIQLLLIICRLDEKRKPPGMNEEIRLGDYITLLTEGREDAEFALSLQDISIFANLDLVISLYDNIISNAVKYGRSDCPIEISLYQKEDFVYCRVRDFGEGIAEAEQGKIFNPFYRVDTSRSEKGFGLGLPLAQKIAQYYHGGISVESEPGQGATFLVWVKSEEKE